MRMHVPCYTVSWLYLHFSQLGWRAPRPYIHQASWSSELCSSRILGLQSGDQDFNDVVLRYNAQIETDAIGDVESMTMTFDLQALGSTPAMVLVSVYLLNASTISTRLDRLVEVPKNR